MTVWIRSITTATVAAMTAVTLTFTPSVSHPTPRPTTTRVSTIVISPPVRLAAAVSPLVVTPTAAPVSLGGWLERIIVPPSASAPLPTPQFPPVVAGTGIDSAIKNIYNAAEPWVQYGFELATYAVGWVPYVGWLAPQIMIFYNFGERIVRSITFNIADWLGGTISFGQGLINVGIDTINSFIGLANDEIAFWLPPLPPIPPIGPFAASQEATTTATTMAAATTTETPRAIDATATNSSEKKADLAATQADTASGELSKTTAPTETKEAAEPTAKDTGEAADPTVKESDQATTPTSTPTASDATSSEAQKTDTTVGGSDKKDETPKAGNHGADSASSSSPASSKTDKKDATPKKDRTAKKDHSGKK